MDTAVEEKNANECDSNMIEHEAENVQKPPCWKLILRRFLICGVERIVLAVFFCNAFTDAISTELILSRTCRNKFGFNEEDCSINMTESVRNIVQPYASNIIMVKALIEALFPAVLSLFIGPWMDTHGRKPFLLLPIIGYMITYAVWLGLSYIDSLSPLYFLIASLPSSLVGGLIAIQACSYSYLVDTTTVEVRALRMAILALYMGLGTMLGYILTNTYNANFKNNLPLSIYSTAVILMLINALYIAICLPETITNNEDSSLFKNLSSLFDLQHFKKSLRILFTKRPEHGKVLILLLIPVIMLSVIIEQGEGSYLLLATKAAFSWTPQDYNNFRSIMVMIGIFIGAPGLWILKRYIRITDLCFLFIIMFLQLLSSLLVSFANTSLFLNIARGFGTFIELVRAVAKTKISFLVLSQDVGKIFAIISTLEAISPLIATPIYSAVYNLVLSYKPLYIFLLSTALCSLSLIFLITVKVIQWKYGLKEVRRR